MEEKKLMTGGEFLVTPEDFTFTPVSLTDALAFESFCLERDEYIRFGVEYSVTFSDAAIDGGIGGQDPPDSDSDPLDPMTAYLYSQFITGELDGYVYDDAAARIDSANALQYTIWYIEGELTMDIDDLSSLTQQFYDDAYGALKEADALIIVTEWDQFREPDYEKMKSLMKGNVIIDGRNIYNSEDMKKKGFQYQGVGR